MTHRAVAALAVSLIAFSSGAGAAPLFVPFDFSRSAIGLDVTVKGTPLYMILDTGVDPSGIDSKRAAALGLPVDRGAGGEATGEGDAKQAQIYPATIAGLAIGGRDFGSVDAAAMDMSVLSAHYGRPLDGVLGYSFLTDRIVLIDYAAAKLGILDRPADAWPSVSTCRARFTIPLRSFEGDSIPVVPAFHFGSASAPITLDTGSNGGIALYQGALDLPGLRAKLTERGDVASAGARGETKSKSYVLNAPVGFGPFTLPAGEVVTVRNVAGSPDTRLANIGNKIFAAMKLKMLLDYRARLITFYGQCR